MTALLKTNHSSRCSLTCAQLTDREDTVTTSTLFGGQIFIFRKDMWAKLMQIVEYDGTTKN
jgi:hypothetical protein